MNSLASFAFLIATVQSLLAAVTTRDDLHTRPRLASKAVATRLWSGMRVLWAFLRRLIILIALEMEWGLVDTHGPMKRPHGRRSVSSSSKLCLKGLDIYKPSPWLNSFGPQFKAARKIGHEHGHYMPLPINMTKLYAQLVYLAGIAANPIAKAKRLAFHLARTRPYNQYSIIIALQGPKRLAGYWDTQVRPSHDAIAPCIMTRSRSTPPPLAAPRTHWPTITAL